MALEIKVPSVGESITEVVVAQWLKPEGSHVKKDEPVVALETDKVNVEVAAPEDGVLVRVLKKAQETATVGEVIAHIEAGAVASVSAPAAQASSPAAPVVSAVSAVVAPAVMPAAERVLHERGLKAEQVQGTGLGGRVLKEDVLKHAAPVAQPAQVALSVPVASMPVAQVEGRLETSVPMTPLRRRIAERLLQAQSTAAILTTFNEVDMTQVMNVRKMYQEHFQKKYGIKLGFMSFFVKAAIDALKAFPEINAEIRGNDIVYHHYYDVGVAVSSERGLVVPVIRNAEKLGFAEIEQTIADFGKRAQNNKLKLEELQGGTFTVSNGGIFGSMMSTPILNPPQSGILGMHAILDRPIGVQGKVELRPMMYIALSYDHRIVDGRGAVGFLKRIKECIEEPQRLLLEV